jgi:hypothetical protein
VNLQVYMGKLSGKRLSFGLFGFFLALVLVFNTYLFLSLRVYFIYNPEVERRPVRGISRDLFEKWDGNKTLAEIEDSSLSVESNASVSPFNFSACLLIKDDNQILPEWIAYHYTVLPLRHLIVAVDPFSLTSPKPILDEFSRLGMDIEVWRDSVSEVFKQCFTVLQKVTLTSEPFEFCASFLKGLPRSR